MTRIFLFCFTADPESPDHEDPVFLSPSQSRPLDIDLDLDHRSRPEAKSYEVLRPPPLRDIENMRWDPAVPKKPRSISGRQKASKMSAMTEEASA